MYESMANMYSKNKNTLKKSTLYECNRNTNVIKYKHA